MSIVRFDPFRGFSIYGDGQWTPAVDIYENDKREVVLKAELPDVRREDISVTVENQTLTLTGERKVDQAVKQDQYHLIERAYGSFSRSFRVPNTVDTGKIAAEYRDGVLTVRLPLREEAKPRTINVEVAA